MQLQHAIDSVRDACRLKHLSVQTEKTYIHWIKRYGVFLQANSFLAGKASEAKMEAFLTSLARAGVAAATQNQAFHGLLFLYREVFKQPCKEVNALRARRPTSLRYCPTRAEVTQLLAHVGDLYGAPTRLITHLLYGCGLRVCEPLNLRLKDVELEQSRLYLHHAKGNKGRVVNFPGCLLPALVRDLQVVLGHNHLETTMLYLHPEAAKVISPLHSFQPAPSRPDQA